MAVRLNQSPSRFDSIWGPAAFIVNPWGEYLIADDWTMDPAIFDYSGGFRPTDFEKGWLAESWEITSLNHLIVHLRQGIHWQDIPPVNGRELIANDIVYTYNRCFGLGDGYTKPGPGSSTYWVPPLKSVTATDKYTIDFKWDVASPEAITDPMQSPGSLQAIVARETVDKWGDLDDWHRQIGTGPFMLSDYVSGSSETLVKNPNYWGYDERYPKNQLPYIDRLKILIIPDNATAMAALRTGKIDIMDNITLADVQGLKKTSPQISIVNVPLGYTPTVDMRNDVKPFNDIKVRIAMQKAVDVPTIAKTYYGGYADPTPVALQAVFQVGYALPYSEWPQNVKDEYTYDPVAAKKLLADAGYPTGFKTNFVLPSNADIDLMQIVKSYFAAVGIDMEIRTMEPVAFTSFVVTNRKHDQIASRTNGSLGVSSPPLMHVTRLLISNGADYMCIDDPVYNDLYTQAAAATNFDAVKKIFKAIDKQVAQQHYVVCLATAPSFVAVQPWFKGYNGQQSAISSGAGGPQLLGFYGARFWIDQNVKNKS